MALAFADAIHRFGIDACFFFFLWAGMNYEWDGEIGRGNRLVRKQGEGRKMRKEEEGARVRKETGVIRNWDRWCTMPSEC